MPQRLAKVKTSRVRSAIYAGIFFWARFKTWIRALFGSKNMDPHTFRVDKHGSARFSGQKTCIRARLGSKNMDSRPRRWTPVPPTPPSPGNMTPAAGRMYLRLPLTLETSPPLLDACTSDSPVPWKHHPCCTRWGGSLVEKHVLAWFILVTQEYLLVAQESITRV